MKCSYCEKRASKPYDGSNGVIALCPSCAKLAEKVLSDSNDSWVQEVEESELQDRIKEEQTRRRKAAKTAQDSHRALLISIAFETPINLHALKDLLNFVDTWVENCHGTSSLQVTALGEVECNVYGKLRREAFSAAYRCSFERALNLIVQGKKVPIRAPVGRLAPDETDEASANII